MNSDTNGCHYWQFIKMLRKTTQKLVQNSVLIASAPDVLSYTTSFTDLSDSDDSAASLSRGCLKYRVGAMPVGRGHGGVRCISMTVKQDGMVGQ